MTSHSHGAPFIHYEKTAPYIYFTHIAALLPCIVFAVFYYGIRALALILFSSIVFCICDNLFAKISRRDQIHMGNYFDLSSIASGMVFALLLPPDTSLFIAFAGVFFGSVVAKQFFGGAGNNILNPACAARLFVGVAFPSSLAGYNTPGDYWFKVDSLIGAGSSSDILPGPENYYFAEIVSGRFPGWIGSTCVILILIGGLFMALKGTIRLYSPIAYIFGILVLYPFFNSENFFTYEGIREMVVFMASSGVLFVAVFMLGDHTTMPSKFVAGIFAGFLCGLFTMILKEKAAPDVYLLCPVLIVNFLSFVLDFFSKTYSRRNKGGVDR